MSFAYFVTGSVLAEPHSSIESWGSAPRGTLADA
jgi:hypothetical protein